MLRGDLPNKYHDNVERRTVHDNISAGVREEHKDLIMPNTRELKELKHLKKV